MQVQPQLILLQKTLFNIEGLGRQLYPELDLWKTARPVLAQWMRERTSPRTIFKEIKTHWPDALLTLRQIPAAVQAALRETAQPPKEPLTMPAVRAEARSLSRDREWVIAAAVLWLSGLGWLALSSRFLWLGWAQMAAAIVMFIYLRRARNE
jgi:ubiquinone biosynthesis protein